MKKLLENDERINRMEILESGKKKKRQDIDKKLVGKDDTSIRDIYKIVAQAKTKSYTMENLNGQMVMDEFEEFVKYCDSTRLVPTWLGFASWLGVSSNLLTRWRDNSRNAWRSVLIQISDFFHNYLQQKTLNGELSPTTYMYMAKNYWGMTDNADRVYIHHDIQTIDRQEQERIINATPYVVDAKITRLSDETVEPCNYPMSKQKPCYESRIDSQAHLDEYLDEIGYDNRKLDMKKQYQQFMKDAKLTPNSGKMKKMKETLGEDL